MIFFLIMIPRKKRVLNQLQECPSLSALVEALVADLPVAAGVAVVASLPVAVQAVAAAVGPASELAEAREEALEEALAVDVAVPLGEVAEAGAAAVTSR